MIGLNAVKVPAIDGLVAEFFLYLPRGLSAVLILVVGHLLAGVLSRTVLIAQVNGGQTHARTLAEVVRLLIVVLVLAMALEQLHLAPTIVVAAFSVIFGGIVIARAIAFGVGGIDAARRVIESATAKRAAEGDKAAEEHQLDHL